VAAVLFFRLSVAGDTVCNTTYKEPGYFYTNLTPTLFSSFYYTTSDNRISIFLRFETAILDFPLSVWLNSIGTYSNKILDLENVSLAFGILILSHRKPEICLGVNYPPPPWVLGVSKTCRVKQPFLGIPLQGFQILRDNICIVFLPYDMPLHIIREELDFTCDQLRNVI
jgi:hypothetical protein